MLPLFDSLFRTFVRGHRGLAIFFEFSKSFRFSFPSLKYTICLFYYTHCTYRVLNLQQPTTKGLRYCSGRSCNHYHYSFVSPQDRTESCSPGGAGRREASKTISVCEQHITCHNANASLIASLQGCERRVKSFGQWFSL